MHFLSVKVQIPGGWGGGGEKEEERGWGGCQSLN